ncbi:MAG: tape measure protein, partial [Eubacterium sp.]|nr:tape measure protein [Eubacterium sp.]
FSGSLTGNADTATALKTARTIQTNLASTSSVSFDGSANVTPGVTGVLPLTNGGTGASSAADARTSLGLGTAAVKGVDTAVTSGSSNLITSGGVYEAIAEASKRTHIVIASYDTLNPLKANADYTCTSTDASDVLTQALSEIRAGGRIELLDGTYNMQWNEAVQGNDEVYSVDINLANVTIEGSGWGTTIVQCQDDDETMAAFRISREARVNYSDYIGDVSKIGITSGDYFTNNYEISDFVETLNKMFRISGTTETERRSSMLQLTQALASGKLQGDEYRSIRENAPMLSNYIADYMGVDVGELKSLSTEGKITSDVLRASVLAAAEDINEQFEQMPMTFAEAVNNIKTEYTSVLGPVFTDMAERMALGLSGNGDNENTLIAENAFWAGEKIREIENAFSAAAAAAGVNGDEIIDILYQIGDAAVGGIGGIIEGIGNFVGGEGFLQELAAVAGGIQTIGSVASGIIGIITTLNNAGGRFVGWLISAKVGMTTFRTANGLLQGSLSSVYRIVSSGVNVFNGLNNAFTTGSSLSAVFAASQYTAAGANTAEATTAEAAAGATTAFTTALNVNPIFNFISAAMALVSALASVAVGFKAAKAASDAFSLTEMDGYDVGSYTRAQNFADRNDMSVTTAMSYLNEAKTITGRIEDAEDQLAEMTELRERVFFYTHTYPNKKRAEAAQAEYDAYGISEETIRANIANLKTRQSNLLAEYKASEATSEDWKSEYESL